MPNTRGQSFPASSWWLYIRGLGPNALAAGLLSVWLLAVVSCQHTSTPRKALQIGIVTFASDSALASQGLSDVVTYGLLWRLGRVPTVRAQPIFLTGSLDAVSGTASLRRHLADDTTLLRIGLGAAVSYVVHGELHTVGPDTIAIRLRGLSVNRGCVALETTECVPRDSAVSATAREALALLRATGIELDRDLLANLERPPCKNTRAFSFFARAEMMRLRGGNAYRPDLYRQWIERAAELDMDFFDVAQRLAELDLQRGDFRAAILALTNATRIRPDWVDGYNQLASVLGAYQAPDKVIEVSRKALHYDPNNLPALANLGAAYLDKNLPDSAIFYLNQALEKDPNNWRLQYNLGAAYTKKGDWQKAIKLLRQALDKRSDVPEVCYFLGVAYNNSAMPGEAIRWFQRTIQLDPNGRYGKLARQHLVAILGYAPKTRS